MSSRGQWRAGAIRGKQCRAVSSPTPASDAQPIARHVGRITVPASTSNLGPGFDLLGLAFDLWLRVEMRPRPPLAPRFSSLEGEAAAWPRDDSNLFLRAFDALAHELRIPAEPFEFAVASEIPLSRGLGSSGAAIVAGIELACAAAGVELPLERRLEHALALEGHPDNVSPALLGGCVLAAPLQAGAPLIVRQSVHPSIAFAVAWPSARLTTALARSLLPAQVSFADARENPRRLALLLEGLRSADPRLLRAGVEDRLHERYRLPHIPGGAAALAAAYEAGAWLACVSGSGSALVAASDAGRIELVAQAMREQLERVSPPAGGRVVRVVERPSQVE